MTIDDIDELGRIRHLMRGLDMAILGCTLNRQEKSGLSHLSDLALIQITAFIDRMTAKAGETDV